MRWFSFERAMPLLFMLGYAVFLAYQITLDDVNRVFNEFWSPLRSLIERMR